MKKLLFRPVDIASLAFVRIIVGILAFGDFLGTFAYYHLYKGAFDPDQFQFRYRGFEWVPSFPEPFMSILFVVFMVLALAFTIGWRYRIVAPLLFLSFGYTFVLEKAHYLNHGYLFCWLLLLMCFLPAWREWSHDVWRDPIERRTKVPGWTILVPAMMMGIAYFWGGVAKINGDWLRAVPLNMWLPAKGDMFLIGPILEHPAMAWFMAYGGLFLDLCIVPLLLWKRTRLLAFGMALFFHFTNFLIFNIGIFPFLSIALTSLYFPSNWPRQFLTWLGAKWAWLAKKLTNWKNRVGEPVIHKIIWQNKKANQGLITSLIILLFLGHCWLPLRHHFIGKDVAWDEFGHRYAWRMMLRTKSGRASFKVVDKTTGETQTIRPAKELGDKQTRKMPTHPDMILQYAHHLRDRYQAQGKEVEIYANVRIKLNDGPRAIYVDPKVDLAQEEWSFWKVADWIEDNPGRSED